MIDYEYMEGDFCKTWDCGGIANKSTGFCEDCIPTPNFLEKMVFGITLAIGIVLSVINKEKR